jgi:NAD(P)-dependent dehydrogenase (short-subunit alcohol dehydrogenase family)
MSENPYNDKTVLVTGASDGVGYATARRLVDDGASVFVHANDQRRGDDAIAGLIKDGAEPVRLHLVVADFTRLAEVASLADQLVAKLPALDVLINNAAIAAPERRTYSDDGHEITFQVNYLAAYILTTALIDRIAKVHGRVLNVSSAVHLGGNLGWTDLARALGHYSSLAAFAQSKLALTMLTRSLAEANSGRLTAISVQVPHVVSDAATILATLGAPDTAVVNGGYYEGQVPARTAALVDNARARTRLTELSDRLIAPGTNSG